MIFGLKRECTRIVRHNECEREVVVGGFLSVFESERTKKIGSQKKKYTISIQFRQSAT